MGCKTEDALLLRVANETSMSAELKVIKSKAMRVWLRWEKRERVIAELASKVDECREEGEVRRDNVRQCRGGADAGGRSGETSSASRRGRKWGLRAR